MAVEIILLKHVSQNSFNTECVGIENGCAE